MDVVPVVVQRLARAASPDPSAPFSFFRPHLRNIRKLSLRALPEADEIRTLYLDPHPALLDNSGTAFELEFALPPRISWYTSNFSDTDDANFPDAPDDPAIVALLLLETRPAMLHLTYDGLRGELPRF